MPRKKQLFQTVNGPMELNLPVSYELKNTVRVKMDTSYINRKYINVPYADKFECQNMDIYLPNEGEGPFPTILCVHGGGWQDGGKDYWEVSPAFKSVDFGFAFCSMEYRFVPEHTFPAQIHDVKAAIRFLKAHGSEYGLDVSKLVIWGASAGGHLASLAGTSANTDLTDRSLGNPDEDESVAAVIDWYGPCRIETSADDYEALAVYSDAAQGKIGRAGMVPRLFGCSEEEAPKYYDMFSPATYITEKCPPFLIQHGTADPLVPYLQSVRLDEALTKVIGPDKVTLDLLHNQGHGSLVFESYDNIGRVMKWIRNTLGLTNKNSFYETMKGGSRA